jgi:hypothetical protein
VDDFTVLVKAGWTNASPVLPRSTHEDLPGFPGLPPAGDPPGLPGPPADTMTGRRA